MNEQRKEGRTGTGNRQTDTVPAIGAPINADKP